MRIQEIEVFVYKYDHHYRVGGQSHAPDRIPGTDYYFEPQWRHAYSRLTESCLVRITTDTGLTGWGEAQAPIVPEVPATLIGRLLGPAMLGLDPADPGFVYDRLYHLSHVRGHTTSYTLDAMAALDTALWDIRGRAEGKPLNSLWEKKAVPRLPLYVSGLRLATLKERCALASEKTKGGYRGVKIFLGTTVEETLEEVSAVRLAIGDRAWLALDVISRHDWKSAYRIGRGLEALHVSWLESPLDPEDIGGHARLTRKLGVPVAIGEALRSTREFEPWMEQGAMDIIQPDIVRCGITGGLRIIRQAGDYRLPVAPHIGVCTAIGVAASWHVRSVLPDVIPQEHQLEMFDTANKVLKRPLEVVGGEAVVPAGPGLGIEVDESFVRAHATERWTIAGNTVRHHANASGV